MVSWNCDVNWTRKPIEDGIRPGCRSSSDCLSGCDLNDSRSWLQSWSEKPLEHVGLCDITIKIVILTTVHVRILNVFLNLLMDQRISCLTVGLFSLLFLKTVFSCSFDHVTFVMTCLSSFLLFCYNALGLVDWWKMINSIILVYFTIKIDVVNKLLKETTSF